MLTEIDLAALEYICLNMRERDQKEIYNICPHDNPLRLAWESHHMILNQGRGRIAWHDGRPAAIAAFVETWPGVWNVFMWGTRDFNHAAIELLRWFRREARDILSVCKGHRLQCDSLMGFEEAHKMIRAFGGVPEGPPMRAYGKDGSDYQRFVWLKERDSAVLDKHFTRAA